MKMPALLAICGAPMYHISKTFSWESSHILHGLGQDHKCSHLHGHNYQATFHLSHDTLDEKGFVVDYGELKLIKVWLKENFDHAHIAKDHFEAMQIRHAMEEIHSGRFTQKVFILGQPVTAENLANYLYTLFVVSYPKLTKVVVKENPNVTATYEVTD